MKMTIKPISKTINIIRELIEMKKGSFDYELLIKKSNFTKEKNFSKEKKISLKSIKNKNKIIAKATNPNNNYRSDYFL